jgi:PKD repeat protein
MKNFLLPLLFVSLSLNVSAQNTSLDALTSNDCANYPCWKDMMEQLNVHVPSVQAAFDLYWSNHTYVKGESYKVFKRWEYNAVRNMDENGYLQDEDELERSYQTFLSNQDNYRSTTANWTELGPFNLPVNGTGQPNGLGRLNYIAFHPTDANKMYVGAPQGGFWLSEDGGTNWITTTDNLTTLGVSSIVVDHTTPSRIYLGSGDRDSNDSPKKGVFVSDDGGYTWTLSNSGMGNRIVGDMIMHPTNNLILIAATNSGVYKTIDAGATWVNTFSGQNFKNITYHPTDPLIVYAVAKGGTPNIAHFYKSIDGGDNWVETTTGLPTDATRYVIGVSPADPDRVYVVGATSPYKGIFQSDDSGDSFTANSTTPNILSYDADGSGSGGQGWYDFTVVVDPSDADVVYVGGVNIFKSTDAGVNWLINAHWWGETGAPEIHADQHWLKFNPLTGNLYSCNDGGLDVSPDGVNWSFTGQGIATAQIYKIGQSTQSTKLINGYQDNGTGLVSSAGAWTTEIGGDGMECIIDPTTDSYCYGELYYGNIRRSSNGGLSFYTIADDGTNGIDESGAWVTPYILHDIDPNTMFVGYKNVWRTNNVKEIASSGVVWTKISDNLAGINNKNITVLEHSPANSDMLYMARSDDKIFRCDDINAVAPTWIDISAGNPQPTLTPTDIEAHPFDENIVYMTLNKKVYKSVDKGVSWTNITGGLPNAPIYCIVYDTSRVDGLYISTNVGVYFIDNGLADWIGFSDGLPVTSQVNELDIYYDANPDLSRIRGGTYGRGLWESALYSEDVAPTANYTMSATNICVGDVVQFVDQSTGFPTTWAWAGTPATYTYWGGTNSSSQNPEIVFDAAGTYTFDLTASNLTGSDNFQSASSIIVSDVPVSDFVFAITGLDVDFTNTSTDYTVSSWDFGDGGNSTVDSPFYTYSAAGTFTVVLTVTGPCGDSTYQQSVTIVDGLGFENSTSLNFKLVPNPADNEISIISDYLSDKPLRVEIINALGQKVMIGTLNSTIDISFLSAGLYSVIVLENDSYLYSSRLMVK